MKPGVDTATGNQLGVTLVELMVVMAIIAVLVAVGVNMTGSVIAKHRLNTSADELATRLRAAQLLAVTHNRPVTLIINTTDDSYHACLDSEPLGSCTDGGDSYLNLDSGRTGSAELSTRTMYGTIDIYDADFGTDTPSAVTYLPPSGLVREIKDGAAFVNGSACFKAEVGDSGDDFEDRYGFRRVSVNPVVGKVTRWRNLRENPPGTPISSDPDCGNLDTGWEKMQ